MAQQVLDRPSSKPKSEPQPISSPGPISRDRVVELATLAALFILAIGLRWPYVHDIPRFTDELLEVLWSLSIARGEILPLVANDPHYGPFWYYLLAGLFVVFGPSTELPRLAALFLGAASVVVTYLFARDIGGRLPATIAAGLLVTSSGHIVINSHTARSNSITPLLTTAALWLIYRATAERRWASSSGSLVERRPDARLLLPAGFLLGLALQTHISVIALAPGVALYVLLRSRGHLRSPWPYLTGLAALAGYAPMAVYNISTNFWTFRAARDLQQSYSGSRPSGIDFYLMNLGNLVQSLSRLLSSTIDSSDSSSRFVYVFLTLAGLVLLARGGGMLLPMASLSIVAMLPLFNPRYGPILSGRYLIPLLPVAFIAIACVVVAGAKAAAKKAPALSRAGWQPLAALAGLMLVLYPLAPLYSYYREAIADGRTNRPLYRLLEAIIAARGPGELVVLDQGLAQEDLGAGGTDLKAFDMLLSVRNIPHQTRKISELEAANLSGTGSLLLLMEAKRRGSLAGDLRPVPLTPEIESASGTDHRYALYRITVR